MTKADKGLWTLTLFQGHIRNNLAKFSPKYINALYLQSGSVDFTQTCMIIKPGHDKKVDTNLETLTLFIRSH